MNGEIVNDIVRLFQNSSILRFAAIHYEMVARERVEGHRHRARVVGSPVIFCTR